MPSLRAGHLQAQHAGRTETSSTHSVSSRPAVKCHDMTAAFDLACSLRRQSDGSYLPRIYRSDVELLREWYTDADVAARRASEACVQSHEPVVPVRRGTIRIPPSLKRSISDSAAADQVSDSRRSTERMNTRSVIQSS